MSIQLNFKCNESWDKMPKNSSGSFCDKCEKNVFDLTNKTEYEIHELYKANNSKLCGRINSNQLGTAQQQTQQYSLAKFCCSLFLVFGSLLFNYELQAQNIQTDSTAIVVKSDSTYSTITGVVIDKETKEPIPSVMVYFIVDSVSTISSTDKEGKYELKFKKEQINQDTIQIYLMLIGYEAIEVKNVLFEMKDIVLDDIEMEQDDYYKNKDEFYERNTVVGLINISTGSVGYSPFHDNFQFIKMEKLLNPVY